MRDDDLRRDVAAELSWDPQVDSEAIDVSAADGTITLRGTVLAADVLSVETSSGGLVILSGTVSSWAAHDHAVAAAWSAPGVTQVDDGIRVESRP